MNCWGALCGQCPVPIGRRLRQNKLSRVQAPGLETPNKSSCGELKCESQDLTCRTVSDQVVFCTRKPSSEPAILAWLLSAWARRAVKPRSRFAVRRRRRAYGPAGAPSHHSSCQTATRSDTVRQIKSRILQLKLLLNDILPIKIRLNNAAILFARDHIQ